MCGDMRGMVCPMSFGMLSKLIGCVLQWGILACVSRSFMVKVGVGRRSNLSFILVLGIMFWHMRVFVCAPRPHGEGGASKVMMGVNHSRMWGCSLRLGLLASMYPIPAGCVLSRK
jgi:hypothetical protein